MASPGPSNTAKYTPLPQDDQMMFAPPRPARPDNDDCGSPDKPIKVRLHLLLAARIVFLTLSLPALVFIVMSYQLPDAAVVRLANDPLGQIHSVTTGTHVKIVPLTSVILAFLGVTMAWNVLQFIPKSTHGSTKIHPCCFSIQCYLSDGDEDDKKPVETRTLIMLVDFLLGLTILLLALGGVLFWQKSWKLNRMTMLCFTIYTAIAQLGVAAFSRFKISRLAIAFLYMDEDSLSDIHNTGTIRLADDE